MRLSRSFFLILILATLAPNASGQQPAQPLPELVEHARPLYPPLARQAHITGQVVVGFVTDGQSVVSAKAESGHPLLREAAEQNVKTWKFARHLGAEFHVTFDFRILPGEEDATFFPPPGVVEVVAVRPQMSIYWGWADLGKWKARLTSARGTSEWTLQMQFSGPDDKWLGGELTGPDGAERETEDGYFDADRRMFGFSVKLDQPGGQPLTTFLIGKIDGDKITGTFVDESGMTGTWTARIEK